MHGAGMERLEARPRRSAATALPSARFQDAMQELCEASAIDRAAVRGSGVGRATAIVSHATFSSALNVSKTLVSSRERARTRFPGTVYACETRRPPAPSLANWKVPAPSVAAWKSSVATCAAPLDN